MTATEAQRLRRIARELARLDPHAAAFQEVVSGEGIEDTGAQIARWISSITGYHYGSRFSYCHDFMEKYPEGVALSLRCRAQNVRSIDLTHLAGGLEAVACRGTPLSRRRRSTGGRSFSSRSIWTTAPIRRCGSPRRRSSSGS